MDEWQSRFFEDGVVYLEDACFRPGRCRAAGRGGIRVEPEQSPGRRRGRAGGILSGLRRIRESFPAYRLVAVRQRASPDWCAPSWEASTCAHVRTDLAERRRRQAADAVASGPCAYIPLGGDQGRDSARVCAGLAPRSAVQSDGVRSAGSIGVDVPGWGLAAPAGDRSRNARKVADRFLGGETGRHRRRSISLRFFGDDSFCAERPDTGLADVDRLKFDDGSGDPIKALAHAPPGTPFRHPAFPNSC